MFKKRKSSMKGSTKNPKEYQENKTKCILSSFFTSMPIRRYIEVDFSIKSLASLACMCVCVCVVSYILCMSI